MPFQENKITISVLTWKSPETLSKTLDSLQPIMHFFSEHLVICQESDPDEIEISKHFCFTPICLNKNIGIQEGLAMAASAAHNETILILENDCNYIGGENNKETLLDCLLNFEKLNLDTFRLGEPEISSSYAKYWGASLPAKRTPLGYIRWRKANFRLADGATLQGFSKFHSQQFTKITEHLFYTTSQYVPWKNRSFITRKSFFLNTLLPFARSKHGNRLINGSSDLEYPINSPKNRDWWINSKFKVGFTTIGLFGHTRLDRPILDEKRTLGKR
jgi:hypothetical protein